MQFHKYVMENLLAPNPFELSNHEKEILLTTFEEIKDKNFPSFLDQLKNKFSIRKEVDKKILEILGFEEDEIEALLKDLYPILHKEILSLKELMAG